VAFRLTDAFNAGALFPSLVMLSLMFTYGTQVAFLPLHADTHGVNPGVFFLVFALTTRWRADPRDGCPTAAGDAPSPPPACSSPPSLSCCSRSAGRRRLGAAGAVYGLAYGTAQPALMAWCV
jgi:hypothetical protein